MGLGWAEEEERKKERKKEGKKDGLGLGLKKKKGKERKKRKKKRKKKWAFESRFGLENGCGFRFWRRPPTQSVKMVCLQ